MIIVFYGAILLAVEVLLLGMIFAYSTFVLVLLFLLACSVFVVFLVFWSVLLKDTMTYSKIPITFALQRPHFGQCWISSSTKPESTQNCGYAGNNISPMRVCASAGFLASVGVMLVSVFLLLCFPRFWDLAVPAGFRNPCFLCVLCCVCVHHVLCALSLCVVAYVMCSQWFSGSRSLCTPGDTRPKRCHCLEKPAVSSPQEQVESVKELC